MKCFCLGSGLNKPINSIKVYIYIKDNNNFFSNLRNSQQNNKELMYYLRVLKK